MYRCQQCDKVQPAGTKAHKKVVEMREAIYRDDRGKKTVGIETVKEITICPVCAGIEKPDVQGQIIGLDLVEPVREEVTTDGSSGLIRGEDGQGEAVQGLGSDA